MSSDLSFKCSLLILKVKMFVAYISESSYFCFWFFFYCNSQGEDLWKCYGKTSLGSKYFNQMYPKGFSRVTSCQLVTGRSQLSVFWATEIWNVCDVTHHCLPCCQKCWQIEGLLLLHFQSCSEWWQSFTLGEGRGVESSGNRIPEASLPSACLKAAHWLSMKHRNRSHARQVCGARVGHTFIFIEQMIVLFILVWLS